MRLKKLASRRNLSALMAVILMQVVLTYLGVLWVTLHNNNAEGNLYKVKRHDEAVTSFGANSAEDNSAHLKTSNQSKLPSEILVNDPKNVLVSKVRVAGSKLLLQLFSKNTSFCNGKIEMLDNAAAMFRNAVVDPSLASAQAESGASIKDVLLQKESLEFYRLKKGYLTVDDCSNVPAPTSLHIDGEDSNHIKELNKAVAISENHVDVKQQYDGDFVIMLTRYEYANVYWTVIDLYDAFLMMQLYNRTFDSTDLWIFDAHPQSKLDDIFDGVFRHVIRPNDFNRPTRFRNLVQCFRREKSPILGKVLEPLPLVKEFRSQVTAALKIDLHPLADRKRRCVEMQLNVLFIWRRNYVAHPRNPSGLVSRKISNEDELLNVTKSHFPKYSVIGEQLDAYPVKRQLEVIGNTDIMIGMHGACFGFVVFMQEGSGVLEMWPKGLSGNWHMEYLAKRNRLYYKSWQNTIEENEDKKEKKTKISTEAVKKLVEELSESVCSKYM